MTCLIFIDFDLLKLKKNGPSNSWAFKMVALIDVGASSRAGPSDSSFILPGQPKQLLSEYLMLTKKITNPKKVQGLFIPAILIIEILHLPQTFTFFA